MSYKLMQFQSTQPSQAVTLTQDKISSLQAISIHTALAGCDKGMRNWRRFYIKFQSTQPSQAVTCDTITLSTTEEFQSTQPSQAVTNYRKPKTSHPNNFNPHSPRRL